VRGGYDPIAKIVFPRLRASRLLLEYDDERSGSFAPLAHVPEDKMAILGLVTTKSARRETPDQIISRVHEASQFIGTDRLGISPQCGFATSIVGNKISEADQEYKLKLVAETAGRIWG
jgi:5-methyltetrahydropteroyltriglutamate--homocysteine methyltransferase